MIKYTLKEFNDFQFNTLVNKISVKCGTAFDYKIFGSTLGEHLQRKYQPEINDEDTLIKSILYVIFTEYGEDVKASEAYCNMVYNYCIGILAVDKFLNKMFESHGVLPQIENYGIEPAGSKTSFRFTSTAIDEFVREFVNFNIDVSLLSRENNWQSQIVTFVQADDDNIRYEVKLVNILDGYKKMWEENKEEVFM